MDGRSAFAYLLAACAALAIFEFGKIAFAWAKRSGRQRLVAVLRHPIFHGLVVAVVGGAILRPPVERWFWGQPIANHLAEGPHGNDQTADQGRVDQRHDAEAEEGRVAPPPEGVVDARSVDGTRILHGAARELRRLDVNEIGITLGGTIVREGVRTADLLHYSVKGNPFGDLPSTTLHSSLPRPHELNYSPNAQ